MTRPLDLTRDDAELLDTLLLDYVKANPDGFDRRAVWMAAELCKIWGMATWDRRINDPVTPDEWKDWNQYNPY